MFLSIIPGTFKVKAGLAQMAKGGIIMDVTTAEEARIAENAGVSCDFCWIYIWCIKKFLSLDLDYSLNSFL